MHKQLLSVFILVSVCWSTAFAAQKLPGKSSENKIAGTTALFVLDGGEEYNKDLQEIIPKVWTITPYKFIRPDEMSNYFGDDNYSLIFRQGYILGVGINNTYLQVFKGLKSLKRISMSNSVASEQLPDAPEATLIYLPNSIERLQLICVGSDLPWSSKRRKERAKNVSTKTLYILESQLGKNPKGIKEMAAKLYPYKIEYVYDSKLEEAIYNQDSSVCYALNIQRGGLSIINAGSSEVMLVLDAVRAPTEVNAEFFKQVMKQVGKPE